MNKFFLWVLTGIFCGISPALAEIEPLPMRTTPIPTTTQGVPHMQIDVTPIPALSDELLRRVAELSGVEIRDTIISLPGAKGFWIQADIPLARPDAIVSGREFAHIHPDGSLHASLSPEFAQDAVMKGWAVYHPWANQRSGWEGFVMVFTPQSDAELDVVIRLVRESYNFVTRGF